MDKHDTQSTIIVGDPHLRIGHKDTAQLFLNQLLADIRRVKPKRVIILGDLCDTFAVLRSEIMAMIADFLIEAGEVCQIVLLVGNHDLAGESGGTNALEPFKHYPNVWVVSSPAELEGIHYVPFIRDKTEFEQIMRSIPAGRGAICHQSFDTAKFQNGFYDPHGASLECVEHLAFVISGHIHLAQEIGRVWYPGTPYQESFSDAGVSKGAYEIRFVGSPYPTDYVRIRYIEFDLPTFRVIEAETLNDVLTILPDSSESIANTAFKIVSRGTPQEIKEFWQSPAVKDFKSRARRVADAITSVKPQAVLIQRTKGMSANDLLNEYIKTRKWRTNAKRVAAAAASLFTDESARH